MRCRKKIDFKKIITKMLLVVILATSIPYGMDVANAETVETYNVQTVVSYAKEHYDDFADTNGGDCTQFVRECIEAGGVPKDSARNYGYTVYDYMQYLLNNGYAQSHKLVTEEQRFITGSQWYVRAVDNSEKLSIGDPVLYYCKKCNSYFHISIVTGIDDDGFSHYYAQHRAVENMPLCLIDCSKCSANRKNVELYSLHVTSKENGYNGKYNDKTVSNLKVKRKSSNSHTISWDSVDGAIGYKVFKKNGATSVFNQLVDTTECSISYTEEESGAFYYFAVRPYFEESGKRYVGKLSKTVRTDEVNEGKLSSPQNVLAVYATETHAVKLSWDKSFGATGYELYRAKGQDGEFYKILTLTGTSCTNSSVDFGKTYYYKVKAIDSKNPLYNSEFSNITSITIPSKATTLFEKDNVVRLEGSNRFGTSADISKGLIADGQAEAIVIVDGMGFPDALAATPFAASIGAPILMAQGQQGILDNTVITEINRIDPDHNAKVFLIGGTGAISPDIVKKLKSIGYSSSCIERIAGQSRYTTAIEVAKKMPKAKTAYIAYGLNYPDALGGGSAAALNDGVILFTDYGKLTSETKEYLQSGNINKVVILGGEGAVSRDVEKELKAMFGSNIIRIAGSDRFLTSVEIAKRYFATTDTITISTGMNFADALAGGPLASALGSPMLMVNGGTNEVPQEMIKYIKSCGAKNVVVLGGSGAVSEEIKAQIISVINN